MSAKLDIARQRQPLPQAHHLRSGGRMTYAQFIKRMQEVKRNVVPMPPLMTASSAAYATGLTSTKARAYLDRMAREGKAVREQPWRRVFYTIGGAA